MTEHSDSDRNLPLKRVRVTAQCKDDNGIQRDFGTGAVRDTVINKLDFEAFLSPVVLNRYAEYLNGTRKQSDGSMRDGDNWQYGIPKKEYRKSLIRHVMDVWLIARGRVKYAVIKDLQTALCAVLFNAMGYLYEDLEGALDDEPKRGGV